MSGPRVLLMTLSERTSAKGTAYMSGWLGRARLVGFKSKEPDKYGNPQWEIYAATPEPKADSDHQSPTRNAGRARQAGEAVVREAREPRLPEPPADWLDDSEAAVRDLEGRR